MALLKDQVAILNTMFPEASYDSIKNMGIQTFNETYAELTKAYLGNLLTHLRLQIKDANKERNDLEGQLIDQFGGIQSYTFFRNDNDNAKLADILLNKNVLPKIVENDQKLIRKYEPVYMEPASRIGRAHLYAPVKQIGGITFDTLWFNVIFIWFTSFIQYLTLYYDLLRKVISKFETLKWRNNS